MSDLNNRPISLKLKSGLFADVNTTTTKNAATLGEPHYCTDTSELYIFDGTENKLINLWEIDANGDIVPITSDKVAIDKQSFHIKEGIIYLGYDTAPEIPSVDDFRLKVDGSFLCIERYTETSPDVFEWFCVSTHGSSVTTDKFYVEKLSGEFSLIKNAPKFPGPGIGNILWPAIKTGNSVSPFDRISEFGFPLADNIVNSFFGAPKTFDTVDFTPSTFEWSSSTVPSAVAESRTVSEFEVTITLPEDMILNNMEIDIISGESDWYRNSSIRSDTLEDIDEFITEEEFARGEYLGPLDEFVVDPINSSNGILPIGSPNSYRGTQEVIFKGQFNSPLEMNGYTIGGIGDWFPDLDLTYFSANVLDIVSILPWVDGTTYSLCDWIVNKHKIYKCNTAGSQSTDFDTNIAKWDELSSYRPYYGNMWQYGDNTQVVITTIDVFEPIPDMNDGNQKGFTFQNTQELKCTRAGKYKVDWNICFNDTNNTTWSGGILINDTIQNQTRGCRKLGANDVGSMGGTGIIDLVVDDIVELGMANHTSTSDAYIDSANLTLISLNDCSGT